MIQMNIVCSWVPKKPQLVLSSLLAMHMNKNHKMKINSKLLILHLSLSEVQLLVFVLCSIQIFSNMVFDGSVQRVS